MASLRGIANAGGGAIWASGTGGAVIHSTDEGVTWQACAPIDGAEKLDFRGLQALDARTAVVMSVGLGENSRVYRTNDACSTWTLLFTNPDKAGFFDTMHRVGDKGLAILGDPVDGRFALFISTDFGETWAKSGDAGLDAPPGSGAFAASNTSLTSVGTLMLFGGKGVPSAPIYRSEPHCAKSGKQNACTRVWVSVATPMATGTKSSGVFSIAGRSTGTKQDPQTTRLVAVGGVYNKVAESEGTASYSWDGGVSWTMSRSLPHGYRSCVAYDAATRLWIAVGPNGTDLSRDDGMTWSAVGDQASGAEDWNAISPPFAVGPKGRIGKWRPEILDVRASGSR